MESLGYRPLHIKQLEEAKHIFSHIEWHMKGYAVKVEEVDFMKKEPEHEKGVSPGKRKGHLLVRPDEINQKYAIPSAFEAYSKYADIQLGIKQKKV